jgi:predicted MFS family arabinose efflux permease
MIPLAASVFIVGALASAAAPGVEVLVIARIVIGVAIGLGCVPALALGFGMLRMPQSPRWA